MESEVTPISPTTVFLATFVMVYGMMSLVDDVCDALRSQSAKRAYADAEDFIQKHTAKWTSDAEAQEEKAAA
jgi:hypothetical protein